MPGTLATKRLPSAAGPVQKLLFIYGTRPEAIKLAPVVLHCRSRGAFEPRVCVTAQHRQLLDQVDSLFEIEPDHDLDLMQPNQSLNGLVARASRGLDAVLRSEQPAAVVIQGDTTTAFVGALTAFHLHVPVAHVEAGLRTWDLTAPFPEELNRQLISRVARWHFAPTLRASENLSAEHVPEEHVLVTGNTAIDALLHVKDMVAQGAPPGHPIFECLHEDERLIVATAHRRESFGPPIDAICEGIRRVVAAHPNVRVVFSVHPNPNVRGRVHALLAALDRVHLVAPMDYRTFVALLMRSWLILSDSGGLQEEAPSLHKPVLVMRDKTERPEALEAGTALLVGTSADRIASTIDDLCRDGERYRRMATAPNPFGDGHASERIVDRLQRDVG